MLPLPLVLSELQEPKSVVPVLSSLRSTSALWKDISNPDRKHIVARSLNLTRSQSQFKRWFGVNVVHVLADNYEIISSDGLLFIAQLLKLLEQCNESTKAIYFKSIVECIDHVCDCIRGKPTLTRELLTPNLPSIIGLYLEKFEVMPAYLAGRLTPYIRAHPTTFRPFGNKLRAKIMENVLSPEFSNYSEASKECFCTCLATLCAIEKVDPEERWSLDLNSLIAELSSTLKVYGEFLDIDQDGDLLKLLLKLPSSQDSEFPSLSIDINELASFFTLPDRIDTLLHLIHGYLTAPTTFVTKIPLGIIVQVVEAILSINVNFLPFKREIRDDAVKNIIRSTLQCVHISAIHFLASLPNIFRGSLVPYMRSLFGLLETLIPMKKKSLDQEKLIANEQVICAVLEAVSSIISLVSYYQDSISLAKFVDASMVLVQLRAGSTKTEVKSNGNKKNKKKKQNSVPLADVLSHQYLFDTAIVESTITTVQKFVDSVITRIDTPPMQSNKINKYLLVEAVRASRSVSEGTVPKHLRQLLVNAVLHPGLETTSILPIVCNILKDEPLLSVFRNPRFPPIARAQALIDQDVEPEEDSSSEDEAEETKQVVSPEEEFEVKNNEEPEEPEVKKRKVELPTAPETKLATHKKPEVVVEATMEAAVNTSIDPEAASMLSVPSVPVSSFGVSENQALHKTEEPDDSDFEMPEIQVDSDDE